jgi:multiple sugar transport system permease protein
MPQLAGGDGPVRARSAVIGQTVLGFALAWTLRDWRSPLRALVEVLVIVAWILPSSVVAFLWIAFLDGRSGTLNALLPGVDTEWLLDTPLLAVIVFNTWRGAAFSTSATSSRTRWW